MVGLAQLGRFSNAERPRGVAEIEPLGATSAGALPLLQPDLSFSGMAANWASGLPAIRAGKPVVGSVIPPRSS